MKKLILFIVIVSFMIFPYFVDAKEYCELLNGSINKPGSEVKCGTENFYVVSSSDNSVNLLAKYNLLVGDKIDVINIDRDDFDNSYMNDYNYCMYAGRSAGYNPYYVYMVDDNDQLKCRIYEKINYNRVRQDEKAVGTKLENGKSVFPLYGIVYMNEEWGYEIMVDNEYYYNEYDGSGNLIIDSTPFGKYLDGYKDELNFQGIGVKDVSFITFRRTLSLLEKVYGKNINVELQYDDNDQDTIGYFTGKMDITNYAKNNEWIYSTTYWLGSGFYGDNSNPHHTYANDYYISNEGMLCAIGRAECYYLSYPIGNGIRPLVTISRNDMNYLINTESDGHGTIEVVNLAHGGETIQFRVNASSGYKLNKLVVTTDSGETVEFDEGSIIRNADGTISIDRNSFTMPFENVTIKARWSLDGKKTLVNPKTTSQLFVYNIVAILIVGSGVYVYKKRTQKN